MNSTQIIIYCISLPLCLMLSACFSAIETAFTALEATHIAHIQKKNIHCAQRIQFFKAHPEQFLSTVLLGNNVFNILITVLSTRLTLIFFNSTALSITTAILTIILLIFGEITPKQLAIRYCDIICLYTIRTIHYLSCVLKPINYSIHIISIAIIRLFPDYKQKISTENLLYLAREAHTHGVLAAHQLGLVRSILRFDDMPLHSVMTHRLNVIRTSTQTTIAKAITIMITNKINTLCIYDTANNDTIVGIVTITDLFKLAMHPEQHNQSIRTVMHQPLFMPDTLKLLPALHKLYETQEHCIILLDEYGIFVGIVTHNDIIASITDTLHNTIVQNISLNTTNTDTINTTHKINGTLSLYQFADIYGIDELPLDKINTISGYIIDLLGYVPSVNEKCVTTFGTFTIQHIKRNHINSVLFTPNIEKIPPITSELIE